MTLRRALAYFFAEAARNLWRSWRVSAVAVLTIAVSLFVGGAFLLVSGNLQRVLERWQSERKVVAYLDPEVSADRLEALRAALSAQPWVRAVSAVSPEQARERFEQLFPSLSEVVAQAGSDGLPASLELTLQPPGVGAPPPEGWLEDLRAREEVRLVDDDRDWLAQLSAALTVGRAVGFVLGLVLLIGAVFTIASVVRLTAYLYSDEIAIMRLVGATEFFIRGPFYAEGLLQGLIGAAIASLGLAGTYWALIPRGAGSVWSSLVLGRFLGPLELLGLLLFGAAAGLLGAVLSLRREKLGAEEEAG